MKRFTETEKWRDSWFRRLSPAAKLLWGFCCDACDAVGVIDLDLDLASFHIGCPVSQEHVAELGSRISNISGSKYFIPKFIEFQYKTLSSDCAGHTKVIELLRKYASSETTRFITDLYPIPKPSEKVRLNPFDKVNNSRKDSLPNTLTIPSTPPAPKAKQPDLLSDGFASQIYDAYPRKVGRTEAIKAIEKILKTKDVSPDSLLQKTKEYAEAVRAAGTEERFIPHPATWFNQGRFEDDAKSAAGFTTKVIKATYGMKTETEVIPTVFEWTVRFLPGGSVDDTSLPPDYDRMIAVQEKLDDMGLWR